MHITIPQLSAQQAALRTVSIGQVGIGPITVGELTLSNADLSMSAAQGVLRNMNVTITLHISVEWHVHVGLPDGIPDIDIGDTNDLGSLDFSLAAGDLVIPGLNNLSFNIPSITAQNLSVSANPLSLELSGLTAEQIAAQNVTLPTAGFTIAGMNLGSVQANGISVPAAAVNQATVGRVHGDPVSVPALTLHSMNLPTAQIPRVNSSLPLDIPVVLQERAVGFDAGLLRIAIHIAPSARAHIEHLEITGAQASVTADVVVLHNVTLPFEVLNLTLSEVGIETIDIPALAVS